MIRDARSFILFIIQIIWKTFSRHESFTCNHIQKWNAEGCRCIYTVWDDHYGKWLQKKFSFSFFFTTRLRNEKWHFRKGNKTKYAVEGNIISLMWWFKIMIMRFLSIHEFKFKIINLDKTMIVLKVSAHLQSASMDGSRQTSETMKPKKSGTCFLQMKIHSYVSLYVPTLVALTI